MENKSQFVSGIEVFRLTDLEKEILIDRLDLDCVQEQYARHNFFKPDDDGYDDYFNAANRECARALDYIQKDSCLPRASTHNGVFRFCVANAVEWSTFGFDCPPSRARVLRRAFSKLIEKLNAAGYQVDPIKNGGVPLVDVDYDA